MESDRQSVLILLQQSIEAAPEDKDSKKRKKSSRFKRRKKVQEGDGGTEVKVEIDEALCRGMVDVLSQTNG